MRHEEHLEPQQVCQLIDDMSGMAGVLLRPAGQSMSPQVRLYSASQGGLTDALAEACENDRRIR